MNQAIFESMAERLKSIPEAVRLIMSYGYNYDDSMEAFSVCGNNADNMMNYLLDRK